MHKSYNPLTREHAVDSFNIDTLRYFRRRNLLGSLFGALLGVALFSRMKELRLFSTDAALFGFYFGGMLFLFIVMSFIARKAGNTWRQSARIAGRRGLFTYSVATIVILAATPWLAGVTLESTVGEFLRYLVNAQIFVGAITTLFDFGSTAFSDIRKLHDK